jgi:phospholipase/carboxylesterase
MSSQLASLLPEGSKIVLAKKQERAVCIGLHGYGDNASNFAELAPEIGHDFTTWVCLNGLSPAPFPMGRLWFPLHTDYLPNLLKSVELVEHVIAHIQREGGVAISRENHQNVSLLGFSQGAALSLAAGLQSKFDINNVFALSGFLPFRHRLNLQETALNNSQFYVSHGLQDTVVFPLHHFEIVDFLKLHKAAKLEDALFPMAHTIHPQQISRISKLLGEK